MGTSKVTVGRCGLRGQQGARGFSASKSLLKLAQRLAKLLNGHSAPARRKGNGVEYRVLVHTTWVCTRRTLLYVCARCAMPCRYYFLITSTESRNLVSLRVIVTSPLRISRVQFSQTNCISKRENKLRKLRFIDNFPVEIFIVI